MPGRPYRSSMFSLCGIGLWTEKNLRHGMRLVDCMLRLSSINGPSLRQTLLKENQYMSEKTRALLFRTERMSPSRGKHQQMKRNQHERLRGTDSRSAS